VAETSGLRGALAKAFTQDYPLDTIFAFALFLSVVDIFFRSGLGFGESADGFVNVLIFTGYVLLSLLGALAGSADVATKLRRLMMFLGISALVFFAPVLLANLYGKFPGLATHIAFGFAGLIITQLWVFVLGLGGGENLAPRWRKLVTVWFILLFVSAIYANGAFVQRLSSTELGGKGIGTRQFLVDLYDKAKTNFLAIIFRGKLELNRTTSQFNETIAFARGDYYTAKVDTRSGVPNKVELRELRPTQKSFRDTDQLVVFATLAAETLETDTVGEATVLCSASTDIPKGGRKTYDGKMQPTGPLTLRAFENYDLTCSFPAGTFSQPTIKSAVVNMTASFDFSTQAYVKTYWMDRQRYLEFRKTNTDPLVFYEVPERQPQTIHTAGPVKLTIGLRGSQQVFTLDRSVPQDVDLTLSLTIENTGKGGRIGIVHDVVLVVPKGMRVMSVAGQPTPPKQIACKDVPALGEGCADDVSTIYLLEPKNVDATGFLTLLYSIKVAPGDYEKILSTSPLTARFFKTSARYNYVLEGAVSVPITQTGTTGGTTGTVDDAPATIVGVPVATVSGTGATLTYSTNKPTKDKAVYYTVTGTDGFLEAFEKDYATKNVTLSHEVAITGLTPATRYEYRVVSTDAKNIVAQNQDEKYFFVTEGP